MVSRSKSSHLPSTLRRLTLCRDPRLLPLIWWKIVRYGSCKEDAYLTACLL
jgi:hypothetical protein